ncbi:hypothetical protein [Thermocrinis sp.]|jgi:transposase-like protein|uniref:hypothetical protein n=1 Tax=Thermocrinis sp. TaxID=2024383 RepID=UPI003BFDABAD
MEAIQVIEEILSKVFKWHRFPVRRWFFYVKHRMKKFYKRFPWNAKYETVYRWLASFIVIYTIMNLKS